uniref:Uncharacterized protein n=1 Tax=Arundo donax TaxID=35708 RepID=A0A0A8ZTK0_ARUDO
MPPFPACFVWPCLSFPVVWAFGARIHAMFVKQ